MLIILKSNNNNNIFKTFNNNNSNILNKFKIKIKIQNKCKIKIKFKNNLKNKKIIKISIVYSFRLELLLVMEENNNKRNNNNLLWIILNLMKTKATIIPLYNTTSIISFKIIPLAKLKNTIQIKAKFQMILDTTIQTWILIILLKIYDNHLVLLFIKKDKKLKKLSLKNKWWIRRCFQCSKINCSCICIPLNWSLIKFLENIPFLKSQNLSSN